MEGFYRTMDIKDVLHRTVYYLFHASEYEKKMHQKAINKRVKSRETYVPADETKKTTKAKKK